MEYMIWFIIVSRRIYVRVDSHRFIYALLFVLPLFQWLMHGLEEIMCRDHVSKCCHHYIWCWRYQMCPHQEFLENPFEWIVPRLYLLSVSISTPIVLCAVKCVCFVSMSHSLCPFHHQFIYLNSLHMKSPRTLLYWLSLFIHLHLVHSA